MKKFIEEFKAFALRGNVVDLAVGVLIGSAFTGLVTAFTDDIINPLLALFGGAQDVTDEMWDEVKRYARYIKERGNDNK